MVRDVSFNELLCDVHLSEVRMDDRQISVQKSRRFNGLSTLGEQIKRGGTLRS